MNRIIIYSALIAALLLNLKQVRSDDEIVVKDNSGKITTTDIDKKIEYDRRTKQVDKTENKITDERSSLKILRDYFDCLELTFKESYIKFYSQPVINMMKDFVKAHNSDSYYEASSLNYQINSMIYNEQKVTHKDKYQAMMDTIRIILPAESSSSLYDDAYEDLVQYKLEQPELAEELLDRLDLDLGEEDLSTEDLRRHYRNFYNHWIPLGRLMKFAGIEPQSKSAEES